MPSTSLKDTLQSDLTTAMRSRDELRAATLRMALTAVKAEEVAGKAARELSDDEVLKVLQKEAKKRREAAEAFDGAGRADTAQRERDELAVIEGYLPTQLGDEELAVIVDEAVIAATGEGLTGMGAMGAVMTAVRARVAGRADGGKVAALVRGRLQG
ncbi:GatB/YqeY domain-containing protein [Kineococcus glutinatus]|uniref:GatB/YqeY domain-containing protein n=1 Tax=Kineococcus glutinatus TaxID=1070872 RepID=A0ABP9HJE0_9ACTN